MPGSAGRRVSRSTAPGRSTWSRRLPGRAASTGSRALIDPNATRTATVTASSDVVCHRMTQWEFGPFVREHPEVAWALLQALAARVREAERREAAPAPS
jgi:CRP-like cAMP-binding protein